MLGPELIFPERRASPPGPHGTTADDDTRASRLIIGNGDPHHHLNLEGFIAQALKGRLWFIIVVNSIFQQLVHALKYH